MRTFATILRSQASIHPLLLRDGIRPLPRVIGGEARRHRLSPVLSSLRSRRIEGPTACLAIATKWRRRAERPLPALSNLRSRRTEGFSVLRLLSSVFCLLLLTLQACALDTLLVTTPDPETEGWRCIVS